MKKFLKIILIILTVICFTQCGKDEEDKSLRPLHTFNIDVPEPSGLDFNFEKTALWTVSDKNDKIYLLDFEGNVKESFEADGKDLEAIAIVGSGRLAVVTEADREIILLTHKGKKAGTYSVQVSGDQDSGLEGLAYDPVNKEYYAA